jgi:hypothetical protein
MLDVFIDLVFPDRPVLILGKGPSLSNFDKAMRRDFYVIGINEVADYMPVDLSFVIHAEHIKDRPTCAPYFPMLGKIAGPIDTSFSHVYHYNLNTAPKFYRSTPIIRTDGFTIHALLNVLGEKKVKKIRTLGIDGGWDYASLLTDVPKRVSDTPFDRQFTEIERQVREYDFDYANLEVSACKQS